MLEQLLETTVEVRDKHIHQGRERVEVSLVDEDGQTLYFYEGHLKELGKKAPALEVGKRYKATFRPFVNNRWIEMKLVRLLPDVGGGS
jgi:hypothetical protein